MSKAYPVEGGIFRTPIGLVQALSDVSFEVHTGENVALVGGSGCGKSTLAKILTGLLAMDAGSLLWKGESTDSWTRLERAQKIQMIFQDPYASLNPKLSIGTQLGEVLRLTSGVMAAKAVPLATGGADSGRDGVAERCRELLESVGLSGEALTHYPFQFSGGQRQRIAIARALAMKPELLVADEPLSALDVTTQAQILELFGQLRQDFGLTVFFITHDLAVAHAFADRIIVLKEGRVVEQGAVASVLAIPQHPYTKALVEAIPKFPW